MCIVIDFIVVDGAVLINVDKGWSDMLTCGVLVFAGEQGASAGETCGGSSLVLSSWSRGGGPEDDSGCFSSDR